MRMIVGELSVRYSGRGDSFLPRYKRVVMYKDDGAISVHSGKGYKPLNYMMGPTDFIESTNEDNEKLWIFDAKGETLTITFHVIEEDISIDIPMEDPGLQRERTETQLQEWLSENINVLEDNLEFIEREYQTGDGPVDILARDKVTHELVAIEVKRVAPLNTVGQIVRYVDAIKERHPEEKVRGVIAAIEIKNKTLELTSKKDNITCSYIPEDWSTNDPSKREDLLSTGLLGLLS